MLDKKLKELLKPIRLKYYFSRLMKYLSYSLLLFSSALLLIITISRIYPVTFIWTKILVAAAISLTLGILWSIYKFPSYYDTARLADSLGLKERTVTALELIGNESKLAQLQKKDTADNLSKENLKKKISIKPSMKIGSIAIAIILSSVLVGFIRTPSQDEALFREKNKNIIKNEIENIKKIEKEVNEEKLLTLEEKKQIEDMLKELRKKLDKTNNIKDIQKEALKAKKELKNLEDRLKQEKIDKIAKKLSDKDFTKELAENLKNKDAEKAAESIKKMADDIKSMNKDQIEKLAKDLEALSNELKDNADLKSAFDQLSEAIAQNIDSNIDDSKLSDSLNSLSEAMSGLMSNSEVSGAISQLNEALDKLSSSTDQVSENGDNNSDGNSNSSGEQGTNQGNSGSGNGGQGNQGGGNGAGQGSGSGSGAGGGAGSGSSPGSENSSGSSAGQPGKKEGSEKEVKEYESIFTPKNMGGEGDSSQVHGNQNNSGHKDVIQIKKFGDMKGEVIPYNEVLNMYKQNAYKRLDNEEIPPNMKEIIRKYFSELE